ncbi:hypothetical protein BL250_13520 [Erwinia sp. OLTSP20]|uniref:Arc family DNA-binding protein n=1 Tax=unclassified Erwinia TaxID=2622719 RepID=UPI000C186523|nr:MULTISPECIES: Arc family DNA-binding protein [unclassified Erwinia]PIJ48530.1 hypothetical protein BV501_16765 [Erwinia sp. OAMSP11]PIJ69150.1 hypothetical protein BK416_15465 [Erwinia sp. OLSSP12]PIJ78795.1 hypothetical protein BLD47_16715 [Erwinia sp. OLCASP19]PIJ81829.1 hypothetical protein BLD46_12150 [Erwinia sp. OLMTSP26]PIJ82107.1 hypothetical protein BLD49_15775 [Erwinia sp. OLMDSP33]
MADTVNLTIKISPELKEQIKALAIENQTSMSYEITQRVEASLHGAVTELHHAEDGEALSATELKQVRALLKKQKQKKKK